MRNYSKFLISLAVTFIVLPIYSIAGNLLQPRTYHTATLLPNGKVLMAGGFAGSALSSAELYDPATGTWSSTGSLNSPRLDHTATLLKNGKVLVVGGSDGASGRPQLNSAELYDPAAGTWLSTGNLSESRSLHTATLFPNGKVLVAGGYVRDTSDLTSLSSAELYDPKTGAWTPTDYLKDARYWHTATLLPSGKILVAGGIGLSSRLNTAELYDPRTGTWSSTGNLNTAYYYQTATLLPNGKVLVVGGIPTTAAYNTTELYDPTTGRWTVTGPLNFARFLHTATLLSKGKVLVLGGFDRSYRRSTIHDTAELFARP